MNEEASKLALLCPWISMRSGYSVMVT